MININIKDKIATVEGSPVIVCGNSDYVIQFAFDDEWADKTAKTARFAYNKGGLIRYQDIVFTGDTVTVPVLADITEVFVGVFSGNLATTTPARIPCELSIRCGTGAPIEPTPSQYDQIMAIMGDMSTLIESPNFGEYNTLNENPVAVFGDHNIIGAKGFNIVGYMADSTNNQTGFRVESNSNLTDSGLTGQPVTAIIDGSSAARFANVVSITANGNYYDIIVDKYWLEQSFYSGNSGQKWYNQEAVDGVWITGLKDNDNILIFPTFPNIGNKILAGVNVIIGDNNKALLQGSMVVGYQNSAEGKWATALGRGNVAGYAALTAGRGNNATGAYAVGLGNENKATGDLSFTSGWFNEATAEASMAQGHACKANAIASRAFGESCTANAMFSVAEGTYCTANGEAAQARGYHSKANNKYAQAEGSRTIASGEGSHAEGNATFASGYGAHAEGTGTSAAGGHSHSEGLYCKATGDHAHAEGYRTTASGGCAHAEGDCTVASGAASHAAGRGNVAGYEGQFVAGKYNNNKADTLFEVGNGTSTSNRSNAFEVTNDGTAYIATAIKIGNTTITETQLKALLTLI